MAGTTKMADNTEPTPVTTEMLLANSLQFLDELPPLMMSIEEKFEGVKEGKVLAVVGCHNVTECLEKTKRLHVMAKESIEAWNITLEENIISPGPFWNPSGFYPSVAPRPLRLLRALDEHFDLIVQQEYDLGLGYAIIRYSLTLSNPDLLKLILEFDKIEKDMTMYLHWAVNISQIKHMRALMNDGRCNLQLVYEKIILYGDIDPAILEMFERRGCVHTVPNPLYHRRLSKALMFTT